MPDIGYGISLLVSDAYPAVSLTNTIGGVLSATPPSPTRDIVDVTSSTSANMMREFISGLIDPGEMTFEITWDPGSATDVLLRGVSLERYPRTWRIIWTQMTPDVQITFAGFLTGFDRSSPLDDKMSATITIKVTGAPVWA